MPLRQPADLDEKSILVETILYQWRMITGDTGESMDDHLQAFLVTVIFSILVVVLMEGTPFIYDVWKGRTSEYQCWDAT